MIATTGSTDETFPPITPALIAALDARFPDRCPDLATSERVVWVDAGSARVVRFLKRILQEQSETILSNPL